MRTEQISIYIIKGDGSDPSTRWHASISSWAPPSLFLHQEHSWKLVGDNENVVLVYNLLLLLISYILYLSLSLPNEPYSKQIIFIHAN